MIFPLVIALIPDEDDRSFMEALYRDHYRLMYATALKYLTDGYDVEDVIEASCESLYRKIRLLESLEREKLSGYIVLTVRHTAQNLCKHKARARSRFSDSPDAVMDTVEGNGDTIEEQIILSEDIAIMKRAILRLTEREQIALKMKFVMDETDEVIAEQIDMAPVSVRQCIRRARDKLKRIVSMEECGI